MRRPRFGDPLPATMAGHAAAIYFRRSDERERHRRFRPSRDRLAQGPAQGEEAISRYLPRRADAGAPILGSRVYQHPDGHAEVGYYPIRPTEIGRDVCDPWPEQVYQWHREGFDLPLGGELLAEGDSFPVQAFRYGVRPTRSAIPSRCDARDDVQVDHARA